MKLIANVEPMGCVRMTSRGKFVKGNAQRYLSYKQMIALQIRKQWKEPTPAACGVKATFFMPIPESWSKKKQREHDGKPVTVKPDIDNLIKGLFDAANGIIWQDDNQVIRCEAEKVYSTSPRIEFEVTECF